MNIRQEHFVTHYIETGNAAYAARVAGYSSGASKQIGYRLKNDPRIKAVISANRSSVCDQSNLTYAKLITMLLTAYESATNTRDRLNAISQLTKLSGLRK